MLFQRGLFAALLICALSGATPSFAQKRGVRRAPAKPAPAKAAPSAAPAVPLLTHAEVVQLFEHNPASKALEDKKYRLLNTPFVDNSASERGVRPRGRQARRRAARRAGMPIRDGTPGGT